MPVRGKDRVELITLDHIEDLDATRLEKLYAWVDEIPLSKPKKNIAKDFSDGVLLAELVKYFLPRYVELHNYAPGCGTRHKEKNLLLLNRKVLSRLGVELSPELIHGLAVCRPMFVENLLVILRDRIDMQLARQQRIRQPDWLITDGGQGGSRGASQMSGSLGPTQLTPNTVRRSWAYPRHAHYVSPNPDVTDTGYQSLDDTRYPSVNLALLEAIQDVGRGRRPLTMDRSRPQGQPHVPHVGDGGKHSTQIPLGQSLPWMDAPQQQLEKLPRSLLEEKEQRVLSCGLQIDGLNAKIQRLEHLCYLKDIRIDELAAQVSALESQFIPGQYYDVTPRVTARSNQPVASQAPSVLPPGGQRRGFNTRVAQNATQQRGW